MRNTIKNKGFTMVELIISLAILAMVTVAIVGVMTSQTSIFRKSKKDLEVQTTASETYEKINDAVMQAKYIYIEGYTSSSDISFKATEKGKTDSTTPSLVRIYRQSDRNILDVYPSMNSTNMTSISASSRSSISDAASLAKFDQFWKNLRYMSNDEKEQYGMFLNYIQTNKTSASSAHVYSDYRHESISGGVKTVSFDKIYVSKIIVGYAVPLDRSLVSGVTIPSDIDKDLLIEQYDFNDNKITLKSTYRYMTSLNNTDVYSDDLNYRKTSGDDVSGAVMTFDSANNALALDMYFADQKMSYTSKSMTVLRNSYVLDDAK